MKRTQIWSCGGGVQSAAIAVLICKGELPKPNLAVIADTEREISTTWDYYEKALKPNLASVGVDLVRVPKSLYATVDLYRNEDILIPAYTTKGSSLGKLDTYCSNEWKQRVVRRWATEQGVEQADIWIGFSFDELRRVSHPKGKWQHKYPLIDRVIRRQQCVDIVEGYGWPTPPRSSCWMCPNKSTEEWVWQKENAPEDFEKAVQFEKTIQIKDKHVWLTNQTVPLSDADLTEMDNDDLFGGCAGGCFT